FLRLPVVSYALPALIAIGQAIGYHRPPRNPITRLIRSLSRKRSLRVLERIQPSSGGFLEATPLTSFVTMSLASIEQAEHPVARKAVEFLVESVRDDGSWAIDSNSDVGDDTGSQCPGVRRRTCPSHSISRFGRVVIRTATQREAS